MPPKKQQSNDKAALSTAQEEEMSSALIAKLLAQDAMHGGGSDYYAEYSNDNHQYDRYRDTADDNDNSYEDESDDYAPKGSRKPKKTKVKRAESQPLGRKRKKVPMDNIIDSNLSPNSTLDNSQSSELDSSATKTGKIKKPKKALPPGFNTGVYTEGEEKLFLEGLDTYGRSWGDLAKHMGTRDSNSVRSHAQKHFIKLYRDNLPLPDKVKESGDGFTLSGKPLDPDSAAAKSYLNRAALGTKVTKTANDTTKATKSTDRPPTDSSEPMELTNQEGCVECTESLQIPELATTGTNSGGESLAPLPISTSSCQISTPTEQTLSTPASKIEKSPPKSKLAKGSVQHIDQKNPPSEATYKGDGRTNYASSRLRRPRSTKSINYQHLTSSSDPLTMVKCEPFDGKPGSNSPGAQPFEMTVHSNVLLTMDFHSHLMSTEIIGFLAGEWDKTTKRISVKEAYPCRSLNTGQNEVNVEMDPTSAIETRQLIEEKNMVVVGWYHSHPTFVPDPSLVDIENQCNYQKLCRDECHTTDDTCAISSFHDSQTPTTATPSASSSLSTCSFSSQSLQEMNDDIQRSQDTANSDKKSAQGLSSPVIEPFVGAIVGPYDPLLPGSASVINWFHVGSDWNDRRTPKQLIYDLEEDLQLTMEDQHRLLRLTMEYQSSPEKVNFRECWRQDTDETKLEKLIKSLATRMPWIQKQLLKIQRQQQDVAVAALSKNVNDITMTGDQPLSNDKGDSMMEEQGSDNDNDSGHGGNVVDSFLEKVQATLKDW
ncbi:hypothetical protein BCR42DRAFT_423948 [Absidia repens]|uniref:Myb-like, SWIRM and MPN domain-containing protein 1 n=1 Tax=Absidia repens TaxID=90262 RepID=A0A1X2I4S4_9FUNG|nr:hypothetical protein BCR42DRAFT_423948 [Absidia repens]